MDEKELDELQAEMYRNAVELPDELEKEISDVAGEVSANLFLRPDRAYAVEFGESRYAFAAAKLLDGFREHVLIKAMDMTDEKRPRKFRVEVEIDNRFSYRENLKAAIEVFLRDRCGMADVGEIQD